MVLQPSDPHGQSGPLETPSMLFFTRIYHVVVPLWPAGAPEPDPPHHLRKRFLPIRGKFIKCYNKELCDPDEDGERGA